MGSWDNSGVPSYAYVFGRSGTDWVEQTKHVSADYAPDDALGWSVSISGDYAIVGVPRDYDSGDKSGSARVFVRTGTTWNEQAKPVLSGASEGDIFGDAVAIDGDYAILGGKIPMPPDSKVALNMYFIERVLPGLSKLNSWRQMLRQVIFSGNQSLSAVTMLSWGGLFDNDGGGIMGSTRVFTIGNKLDRAI